jgi:hypothetical protein
MTADSGVISENGNVAVHVLHWRNPITRFQFNTQHVKVKTRSFLWLIHESTKLQVAHPTPRKQNGDQLSFRKKQSQHHCKRYPQSQKLKTLFCSLKANLATIIFNLFIP